MSHNSRTIYPHALRQGPDDLRFRGVERQGCRRVGLRPLGQLQLSASTDTGVVERPRRTSLRPLPQPPPVPRAFASGSLMAWQVNCVLAYIEAHIETSLRATELAALARLSSGHFSRAFRVSIGQSPHAYVLCRRVEWAKRLMLSEELAAAGGDRPLLWPLGSGTPVAVVSQAGRRNPQRMAQKIPSAAFSPGTTGHAAMRRCRLAIHCAASSAS